uniref:EB domain-containing protein n=1 Tax=Glossina austeni TaxID=7395 RepID=A0A1A9UFU9_GLOAU
MHREGPDEAVTLKTLAIVPKGKYIGAPCNNMKCETSLVHVTCEKETLTCGCEKNYPVQLGLTRGCDKPKKLGEQCFYDETCQYNDENSLCVQVRHNALCQCASGFHSVSYTKPTRRVFCTQDLDELNSDLPTLLGVCLGIGVLAGLICMVLHLFSKTKYPRHRNFGDANLPPPIMYSSETGILSTVQSGRPSSRSSIRSSGGSVGSYGNRRTSSVGGTTGTGASKGILVSTSRTGAARSAAILLISCHLSAISKQNSRVSSRQTSGAGCSANSRDNLDENGSNPDSRSCDSTLSMTRHLQKQLNHQRHLLSFELSPAKTKNHDRVRALLGLNGIDNYRTDDDDFNSLENGGGNHLEIGALPTPASETPCFAVKLLDKTKLNQLNKQISIYCPHQTYKQKTEKKRKQHEQQHTTLHFLMKFAT